MKSRFLLMPSLPLLPLLLAGLAACQDPAPAPKKKATDEPPAAAQDPKQLYAEMLAKFKEQGIELDLKQKSVSVPAIANYPRDPVEYLLIHQRGKRHEAMFITKAQPSILNGALLLVGLQRGKNASVRDIEPFPTREEVEAGAETTVVTPPVGKPFWMTVNWLDEDGERVEHCVEDLLLDLTTQEPVQDASWVYLGGRMARIYKNDPEVYVADYEGNLVSICYLLPDNHLATMRHKDARDDQNWWLSDDVPEPGTEVRFVFHAKKPKLLVERDKRRAAALKKEAAKAAAEQAGQGKEPAKAGAGK
ncbi:MAG: YdjY domain-containing protein [bacterium]|nr:YdjY domain-containing protein [bacterium]